MNQTKELKQNLYTSLKEIGLTESEANLYITSLSLGPTTIASLAEHLHIPRPNVYKVITGLEEHGLAVFSERKRYARTFMGGPPTVVLEKIRQKRESWRISIMSSSEPCPISSPCITKGNRRQRSRS